MSDEYQRFLPDQGLVTSMGAVGRCGDKVAAEGFFGRLKRERVNRRSYRTWQEPGRARSTTSSVSTMGICEGGPTLLLGHPPGSGCPPHQGRTRHGVREEGEIGMKDALP